MVRRFLHIQWKSAVRGLAPQRPLLRLAVVCLLTAYAAAALIALGLHFERVAPGLIQGEGAVAYLNRLTWPILAALLSARFLMQRSSSLKLARFLQLPIERSRLVAIYQLSSLFSLHNVLPAAFFVSFWSRYVLPSYPLHAAILWLVGMFLAVLSSHFVNLTFRSLATVNPVRFYLLAAVIGVIGLVDELNGGAVVRTSTSRAFELLLDGDPLPMLPLLAVIGLLLNHTSATFKSQLLDDASGARAVPLLRSVTFSSRRSTAANLILLELQLIWRNRRPRTYFLFAIFFGLIYVSVLLMGPATSEGVLTASLAGVFASGIFAFNHGQLMFAWDSTSYDGLLTWHIDQEDIALSKLITLQLSCVLFFFLTLPMFIVLAPHLLALHVAFMCYNAGITSAIMVVLASHNRRRVEIDRDGGFFNYEGFSLKHWFWLIPTAVPPALLLHWLEDDPARGLLLLGGAGLGSLLLTSGWVSLIARILARRKYVMAAGFRGAV